MRKLALTGGQGVNRPFDLAIAVLATLACFVVGWFWSMSMWHTSFDMGWLIVAFAVARTVSMRLAKGRLRSKEYLVAVWPVLPAFLMEGLSNKSLHQFSTEGTPEQIVQFSIFSCLLLIVIVGATALLKFGKTVEQLSSEDYSLSSNIVRVLALAASISLSIGTVVLLTEGSQDVHTRLVSLQSWFYKGSLMVYFILVLKVMLPIVLDRARMKAE